MSEDPNIQVYSFPAKEVQKAGSRLIDFAEKEGMSTPLFICALKALLDFHEKKLESKVWQGIDPSVPVVYDVSKDKVPN